ISKVSKKLLGCNPMMFRRAFHTPACMSVSILGMAQSKLLWTSQMNIVVLETKSDLAATSLELSCDPDRGELSSKELRPVKCKDGTVSNDKESIELSDSNLMSQLTSGCVTCHTCHGCVTDFRPILGNPVEVAHMTSPGTVYISYAKGTYFPLARISTMIPP